MSIGNQIMSIRRERQLTQEQFGSLFHVTRQTVSNWENGKSYPDLQLLVAISDQFGISLDTLLKEDTKMVKAIDRERGLEWPSGKSRKSLLHKRGYRAGRILCNLSGICSSDGNFHRRIFDDTYRLVETVALGRENAFTLSGEPRREKLITILFNLDLFAPVCYHVATDTRRKEGL